MHLETGQTAQAVSGVLERAVETQVVTCGELQGLVLAVIYGVTVVVVTSVVSAVITTIDPRHVDEFCGVVCILAGVVDVQLNVAHVVQTPLVAFLAEKFVLNAELGSQVVLLLLVVAQVGISHGVAVLEHITEFPRGVETVVLYTVSVTGICCQRQHVEIHGITVLVINGSAIDVVCIYAHVGHSLVSLAVGRVGNGVVMTCGEGHVDV